MLNEDAAPRTELENALTEIWKSVLGLDTVGINDNFFDLGGHSLLAIEIAARIRELLPLNIQASDLNQMPTIAEMNEAIVQSLLRQADKETVARVVDEGGLSSGGMDV